MPSKLDWSLFQQAIFKDVENGIGNTIIEAKAGSSKTTSLLESLKYIPRNKKTIVVAFNKSIKDELIERAPQYSNLEIMTLHSLGFRAIRNRFGKDVKFSNGKTFGIIKNILQKEKTDPKEKDDYESIYEFERAVGLCKNFIIDVPSKIDELLDEFGIDTVEYDRKDFISKIIQILGECKKDTIHIDFNDMIWFPFVYNLPLMKYDRILTDESQDFNMAQMSLIFRSMKEDSRVFVFLDTFQAVYSWRGANTNAAKTFKEKLNAKTLELPISYRCANRIIYAAQKYVPGIKPAPNAKEGEIINIGEEELLDYIRPGDFLLSRTNAPLFKWCLKMLRLKIPANIRGKGLDKGLLFIIKQSKKKNIESFLDWLKKWEISECARLKEKNRDNSLFLDKIACLRCLCEGVKTTADLQDNIKLLFNEEDGKKVITCSTIHGIKGAEETNVFILEDTFRFGDSQEEQNLKYVAITRAKEKLYWVKS